jgi:hypothetical protein
MRGHFSKSGESAGKIERGYVQSWAWKLESGHELDE